jgi:hypothetical protein
MVSQKRSTKKHSSKKQKSSIKKSSSIKQIKEYSFQAWYKQKPKINKKFKTLQTKLRLDDDDEWLFDGFIYATTIPEVKKWLKSLGTIKRYSESNKERLEVSLSPF